MRRGAPPRRGVVCEGALSVEEEERWTEKYVRLLPGSLAYWSFVRRPRPGESPAQLYLLDDLEFHFEEPSTLAFFEPSQGIWLRLEAAEGWLDAVQAQYVVPEDKEQRSRFSNATRRETRRQPNAKRSSSVPPPEASRKTRSQSVPPPTNRCEDAKPGWDDAARRDARDAMSRRDSEPRRRVLAFARVDLGFSLELVRANGANRLVVPKVRDTCEHKDLLSPGDELVAVNGANVPDRFPKEAFTALLDRLAAAPRPIRLTFDAASPDALLTPPESLARQDSPTSRRDVYPPEDEKKQDVPKNSHPEHAPEPKRFFEKKRVYKPLEMDDDDEDDDEEDVEPKRGNAQIVELAFSAERLGFVLARERRRGLPVVSHVRDSCEHKNSLRVRDELVAVDGASVPVPLTDASFDALLKIIKASKRPLTLKLRRAHPLQRSATDASKRQPHSDVDDAQLSWQNFVQKHADEATASRATDSS